VPVNNVIAADSTAAGKTTFTVDRWGQPLTVTDPLGQATSYAYDNNGFVTAIAYPSGGTDQFSHSGGPFLTKVIPAGLSETDYQYGPYGQVVQVSGTGQPTQTLYVSANGHTDSASVNGSTWRYYGDALGRDTLTVDAAHDSTKYRYDIRTGNLDTVKAWESNRFTAKTFDGHGREHTITVSTPNGPTVVTTTAYDSSNRVITSTDGLHPTPIRFTYDSLFQTGLTDPKGQPYHSTYNALGWMLTETDTANRSISATYNSLGLPTTGTNRRTQHVQTLYDTYGRPTTVTRPATEPNNVDKFRYSTKGDTVVDSNAVVKDVTYSSQTTGLVDSIITTFFPNGHQFKRAYGRDTHGRVTSVTTTTTATGINFYPRTTLYDANTGLITGLRLDSASHTLIFSYDSLFRLASIIYPNVVTRNDSYTNTGALSSTSWSGLLDGGEIPFTRAYGYDSTGRIQEIDVDNTVASSLFTVYSYNALGELVESDLHRWTQTVTNCPGNQLNNGYGCHYGQTGKDTLLQAVKYSYDAASNLDTIKVGSTDTVATILPGNRLSAWTGMTFAGDSDGNRLSKTVGSQTTSYAWGADGRLLSVTQGSTVRTYDYDAVGQLVRRSENGTPDRYYLWDNGQILAILDGTANNRVAEFVYFGGADQPLARITGPVGSSTIHYYAQDVSNNVIAQFTDSTIDQSLSYDPWGATTISPHSDTTQLRWKGLLYEDGITSLYYMRARWYDPTTRRFVSPDPMGLAAGVNQYAYSGDDPVNGADPTGLGRCSFYYNGVSYSGESGMVGITVGGMAVQCGSDGHWYTYYGPLLATVTVTAPYNYGFLPPPQNSTSYCGYVCAKNGRPATERDGPNPKPLKICGGGGFVFGGKQIIKGVEALGIVNYDSRLGPSVGTLGEVGVSAVSVGYERAYYFKSHSWGGEWLGFFGRQFGPVGAGFLGTSNGDLGGYVNGKIFGGGAYVTTSATGSCGN
jgi:RHS repeat-associated protein